MKKKSIQVTNFIENMHKYIINDPQFRKDTRSKKEIAIQTEIRPIIINYLTDYFSKSGYKDAIAKANKSFYWEGQEGTYGEERETTFGTRNYPDYIIKSPYLIALEYKQSPNGSTVKQGIGQSIMHTLCEEFHYVYYLFHDQSIDRRIETSIVNDREKFILDKMWKDFNVYIKFV